jgi:Ca2+-binding EF-hand superfamily protein
MRLEKPEFCALYEQLATALPCWQTSHQHTLAAKMQQAGPIRVAPAIAKAAADTADSVFDEVDKDQDGKMTEEEFCTWAEHNLSKAGMFFAFLDEDDFQTGVSVIGEVLSFQDKVGAFWMKAVFEFDDNVNMRLEKPEFCALYAKLAAVPVIAQTAQSVFDEVDKDQDGKMTEKEFTAWAEQNQDKASMFFAFIDEARLEREGYVSFHDKVNTFWLNAVVEFDDNGNMRLEKPEFCALYEQLAAAKKIEIMQAPAPDPEVHFVQAPAIKVRPAPEGPSGAALYKQYAKAAKEGERATSPSHKKETVEDEWSKMLGGQTEDHHLRAAEQNTSTKPSASIEVDVKLPGVEIEVSIKSPFS